MAMSFDGPVVSPIVIGRDAQIASVERALERVSNGFGQTVLFAGEAGIGKTRLVAETRLRAERMGFRCLEGRCFEPDRALPYGPLIDLLRGHLGGQTAEEPASELSAAASDIARRLPELSASRPDLGLGTPLDADHEKRRLLHALARYLLGLAESDPLLVVVEDLHWCDDASLDLLLSLSRRLVTRTVLLLLTYRSEDAGSSLDHFLAELDRGRLAIELTLDRLDVVEVDAMVRAIFDLHHPIRADFLQALSALSEGNPFFIEEALTSMVAAGDIYFVAGRWGRKEIDALRIPRSVQDAVRRRAARLSDEARQVLHLAAVVGRRFDFALLQTLTGRGEGDLLGSIKELIAAQLVVEASAEQFAFRHALTRQAVYGELLARERKTLHRQIVGALIRVYGDSLDTRVEELAYHAFEADDWSTALEYAARAGDRAFDLHAPWAAIEQYSRALEAARQLSIPAPSRLLRGRGLALERQGDFERSRADLEAAIESARLAGDQHAEWQAMLDLGLLWSSRDYERTGDLYRRALALARSMDDPATLAHSLNRLGNWHVNVERPVEARQYHDEALTVFRGLDDRHGVAETLDLLGLASLECGDPVASAVVYREAMALFRDVDDRLGLASSMVVQAGRGLSYVLDVTIAEETTLAETIHEAELAVGFAHDIGWRGGEAYASFVLGGCLGTAGRYGRGLEQIAAALAIAEEVEHRQWLAGGHCTLGALYLDLLVLPQARRRLEHARDLAQEIGSRIWSSIATALLAVAYVRAGSLSEAKELVDAMPGRGALTETLGQRLCGIAVAELALARGSPAEAITIADRLIAATPGAGENGVVPRLWHIRAQGLAALGQSAEAEGSLLAAVKAATAQGRRPLLWQLQRSLGEHYRHQRRRDAAEGMWAAARAIVDELAAEVRDEAIRAGFLREADALLPPSPPLTSLQIAKRAYGGLTAREREVAVLIAQGRSNRAIADELSIGERTVEGHVANILAKLGFSARTQIAAWTVDKGLTTSRR